MVLRDGNKYACESCIRGHRVTGCNHTDRELHFIAPKGRPVKQCEHCRGARKSKSHHAKCDCGGKRERNEIKLDDKECCCNLGDSCVCGVKKEDSGLSMDTLPPKAAHSRPHPMKNTSDGHLTTYINSKHKACHKWDVAQSHGPYPRPKLNAASCHSSSPSITSTRTPSTDATGTPQGFSQDDWHVLPGSSTIGVGLTSPSLDSLPLSFFGSDIFQTAQPLNAISQQQLPGLSPIEGQDLYTIPSNDSMSATYLEDLMSANANAAEPAAELMIQQGGPSTYRSTQDDFFDAEKASFGSNDLPLKSGTLTPDFARPTAFTDDSAAHSAPGLTAASSTAPSELGDMMVLPDTSADGIFDATALPLSFDYTNIDALDPNVTATSYNMPPPPTSNPSPNVARRSLDAQALKSLSTFPAFDTSATEYLSAPPGFDPSSVSVPAPTDAKPSFLRPTPPFDHPSTTATPPRFADQPRPRSVTIPASHHYSAYNPNATIDQMYPQLTQDFAAAADWDPNAGLGAWGGVLTFSSPEAQ